MAIIDPVPVEDIEDPKVQGFLEKFAELGVPDKQFMQLMAHVPSYANVVGDAMYRSHAEGDVDHKLKELIRIQLARRAEDPYFGGQRSKQAIAEGMTEDDVEAGSGDFMNDDRFTDAEKWALNYAFLMYRDPKKVNADFYEEGKRHYTEAQIMELGAFIAFHYGMQVWTRTLGMIPE